MMFVSREIRLPKRSNVFFRSIFHDFPYITRVYNEKGWKRLKNGSNCQQMYRLLIKLERQINYYFSKNKLCGYWFRLVNKKTGKS